MSLLAKLRRRKFVQWLLAYAAGAWALLQVLSLLISAYHWPDSVLRIGIVAAVIGFFVTLVLAWYHGERGEQKISGTELLILALLLAIGGGILWRSNVRVPVAASAPSSPPATAVNLAPAATAPQKSIAVLAFTDLSPKHDQDYFSDGIAEELLNALAKVNDLKVAGRTSSFYYKGRNEDLRTIGKALGVANVLEGSVRTQGDKVRITAQLIRSEDGFHLWSESYDGDLKDVFALQERIARAITDQLQVVLAGKQAERLVNAGTENAEAYALYLQATAIFDRRDGEHMPTAIKQLEQAIALDPRYARAYSRLAAVNWVLPIFTGSDPAVAFRQVRAHAHRAIELDAHLAEPWAALAMASSAEGGTGMLAAREQFEKALQLEPDDVTSNFWFGLTLLRSGYTRAGAERMEHALAVDPMVPNVLRWRGVIHLRAGEVERAEPYFERAHALGLAIAARELAELAGRRGDMESARRLWFEGSGSLLVQVPPGFGEALATALYGGDASDQARGLAAIDTFLARKPLNVPSVVPLWLAQLGRGAQALEVERTVVKTDNSDFMAYLFSPAGSALRALPEFPGYLRAKGFPALWDKYGAPDICHKNNKGEYVCE